MNTNEILELLEVQCDGMNRDGPNGLLFFLNTAQDILCNSSTEQNIKFDTSTGKLPVLNTIDNKYEYDAPSDCWKIAGILIEAIKSGSLMDDFYYHYSDYGLPQIQRSGINGIERLEIGGIEYVRCPYARTYYATDSGVAKAMFTENPGNTEDIYLWYYYKKPAKLYSDNIELTIPPPYDYLYLFPAVVRLVQGFKDGDFLKAHTDVKLLRQKYMLELNKGEQGFEYNADDRGF